MVAEEVGEAKTGVEAIDDVQVRLHSPQAQWDGKQWTLFFKTDLQSKTERVVPGYGAPLDEFFVQLDGEWFEMPDPSASAFGSEGPSPGKWRENLHTWVGNRKLVDNWLWRSISTGLPMP